MLSWSSHIITFLVGTATGAAAGYFAARFTDQRRTKESRSEAGKRFGEVCAMMPEFIAEMRADFSNPDWSTVRELIVLPSSGVTFSSNQKRFRYHENEHDDLLGKIAVLQNHGYIFDITEGNVPIYRITEEFLTAVKTSA